jgi:hypothetical protein
VGAYTLRLVIKFFEISFIWSSIVENDNWRKMSVRKNSKTTTYGTHSKNKKTKDLEFARVRDETRQKRILDKRNRARSESKLLRSKYVSSACESTPLKGPTAYKMSVDVLRILRATVLDEKHDFYILCGTCRKDDDKCTCEKGYNPLTKKESVRNLQNRLFSMICWVFHTLSPSETFLINGEKYKHKTCCGYLECQKKFNTLKRNVIIEYTFKYGKFDMCEPEQCNELLWKELDVRGKDKQSREKYLVFKDLNKEFQETNLRVILCNLEGWNDDHRGMDHPLRISNNLYYRIPFFHSWELPSPCTLEDLVKACRNIKSQKWDGYYEFFSQEVKIVKMANVLYVCVDFNHRS